MLFSDGGPIAAVFAPSFCLVNFSVPFLLDGQSVSHYVGPGLVLDEKRGLLVTDRNTVPTFVGDLTITFASAVEIPGKVGFEVKWNLLVARGNNYYILRMGTDTVRPPHP